MDKCVADGNLITGATYDAHPEFISLFVKALGGSVTGSDKKILFLCGVCLFFIMLEWFISVAVLSLTIIAESTIL